jgi:gamma-glutamylcyclotransferase (GGCT)/AIG2-like uncharacterized protein YtfP
MARFLEQKARIVSVARSPGRLYDLGLYPAMLAAQTPGDWVLGDLFEMNDPKPVLAELDRYEGCIPEYPDAWIFGRVLGTALVPDNTTYRAWLYLYNEPISEERRIITGDYFVRDAMPSE